MLVSAGNSVKVIDFGVAKAVAEKRIEWGSPTAGSSAHLRFQPGAVRKCASGRALRHLLVRRDALVFAHRSHAFQRPDD